MKIDRLDHLVLTVASLDATCDFYTRVLGMTVVTFGSGRRALQFGREKINLHEAGREFEPKAHRPTPGSADLCFIAADSMADVVNHMRASMCQSSRARLRAPERSGRSPRSICATRTKI